MPCSPATVAAIRAVLDADRDYLFELVSIDVKDGTAFITAKFKDAQLENELLGDLRAAGMPISDWDLPDTSMGPGSLTRQYAEGTAVMFNRFYLDGTLIERHGEALASIIATHEDVAVKVVSRPYYTAEALMPGYQALKAKHLANSPAAA